MLFEIMVFKTANVLLIEDKLEYWIGLGLTEEKLYQFNFSNMFIVEFFTIPVLPDFFVYPWNMESC